MDKNKLFFAAFILLCLVQLYIPAKTMFSKEMALEEGNFYRFRTAPIDPNDPFRGKYITLTYADRVVKVAKKEKWKEGQVIYVYIAKDSQEYATLLYGAKEPHAQEGDYFKATVISTLADNRVRIRYPFNRYYMEESKAKKAEILYRKALRDTKRNTYALVAVKDGEAVLKDVLIDGNSIKDMIDFAEDVLPEK